MIRDAALSTIAVALDVPALDSADFVLYAIGWLAGWFLLARPRPLPAAGPSAVRRPIAIVIPARDEARTLGDLLTPLVGQLVAHDELLVVDDHSADGTAEIATSLGARVVSAPPLPDGWLGKPHACWHGARHTAAPTLLFLDADVRPPTDLLARVSAVVDAHPGSVVSVQPWHATERPHEQLSMLCNVAALMGSGAFTALGSRVRSGVAFGAVIAIDRVTYDHAGGHAHPTTRRMHTEDIGLARAVGRSTLFTGRPGIAFRMYPGGWRETVQGWTRTIATGARFTPWWAALLTLAWVWSLAGGWIVAPIVYPLSALQVFVLGRRAGSMHPVTALLYPLAIAGFVLIFLRSLVALVAGRQVAWKGRRVDTRSAD